MTKVNETIQEVIHGLECKMRVKDAWPDMAIALLTSYIKDNETPHPFVLKNIRSEIFTPGIDPHKRDEIVTLLNSLKNPIG